MAMMSGGTAMNEVSLEILPATNASEPFQRAFRRQYPDWAEGGGIVERAFINTACCADYGDVGWLETVSTAERNDHFRCVPPLCVSMVAHNPSWSHFGGDGSAEPVWHSQTQLADDSFEACGPWGGRRLVGRIACARRSMSMPVLGGRSESERGGWRDVAVRQHGPLGMGAGRA